MVRPVLDNHPNSGFTPLQTIWIICLQASLMLLLGFMTFIFAFIVDVESMTCGLFFLVVYAHACLWVIFLILDNCLKWYHSRLRKEGYLEFYETCNKYAIVPIYITSSWNVILGVRLALYSEMSTNPYSFCDKSQLTSPTNMVAFLMICENLMLLPVWTSYIIAVLEFNKSRRLPDTDLDNRWVPNVLRESISAGEVGYRERCEAVDNMLEKQADLIRYYKESNEQLNRRILELTVQCRNHSINS